MSMSLSADLSFGVDVQDRNDGYHFECGEELPAPWDTEGAYLEWDDLIAEFAGFTETDWQVDGYYDRRREALKDNHLAYGSYGYDFGGTYISVGDTVGADYGLESFDSLPEITTEQIESIKNFVKFLDSKGLVLKEGYREPRWMLSVLYG